MAGISSIGSTPSVTGADGTSFSAGADRTSMDTNMFLKLLMAQQPLRQWLAVLHDQDAVVGHDAVEIEDEKLDLGERV